MNALRARVAGLAVAVMAAAGVGCSLLTDLGGLAGDGASGAGAGDDGGTGTGTGAGDARVDSGSSGTIGEGGTTTGPDGAVVTAGCDRVKVTALGCDGVEYMPALGGASTTATRAGSPEVVVFGQHNPSGTGTRVTDERSEPHVLVLASHDVTKWTVVVKTPGALKGVFLSGYDVSSVTAPAGVPVTANGHDTPYAYEYPSPDANELFQHARTLTGATAVTAFAGCHDGVEVRLEDGCP